MDNAQRMNLVYSVAYLFHQKGHFGLWQLLRLFKIVVKLTSSPDLQNNIDVLIVIEVAISFDYVRMVKVRLYFEFSNELLCNLFLYQKILLNYFQGTDKTSRFLPH